MPDSTDATQTSTARLGSPRRQFLKAVGSIATIASLSSTTGGATQLDELPIANQYLQVAVSAAREGAAIHTENFGEIQQIEQKEDRQQLVTEVDRSAEQAIRSTIREELGNEFDADGHAFFGEEEGGTLDAPYVWIIDPLDGTTNYVNGIPHFAVSIGLAIDGERQVGVVYYTPQNTVYTAVRGEGAFKFEGGDENLVAAGTTESLSVTDEGNLQDSFFTIGLNEADDDFAFLTLFRYLFSSTQGVRRLGAAAADLSFVADGIVEGFTEKQLSAWDVAAGTLLVEEAGGEVTDFEGDDSEDTILDGTVVATNGLIHDSLLDIYDRPDARSLLISPIDTVRERVESSESSTRP
ncbi:inositol monophosphatase family protein [Haloarcula nitratireducens]|uniref:Inositol monophosphatase n=1 Tax=Haloarcula nitratireducens TaxID=2487749 RepID=A0AAW4PEU8_9EURY|nr:inositol monophosphatase family protein [Halomicroarcula nitratireducens]MBX0296141.1 inositol monophosphatase [Halomicroarcula nitratireducens]